VISTNGRWGTKVTITCKAQDKPSISSQESGLGLMMKSTQRDLSIGWILKQDHIHLSFCSGLDDNDDNDDDDDDDDDDDTRLCCCCVGCSG
jgi:hypothetical protein